MSATIISNSDNSVKIPSHVNYLNTTPIVKCVKPQKPPRDALSSPIKHPTTTTTSPFIAFNHHQQQNHNSSRRVNIAEASAECEKAAVVAMNNKSSVVISVRRTAAVLLVFCCCTLRLADASLSITFPQLVPFRPFANSGGDKQDGDDNSRKIKNYSGRRAKNDSIRMVYVHDQTVAVVEVQPDRLLLSCELIEVYGPEDTNKAIGDLQKLTRPVPINFKEMTTLMNQCEQHEKGKIVHTELTKNSTSHPIAGRGILANNPLVLLSGIIPGTKWCGTGDIAKDYYDLGTESEVDKCCRSHDLCPVKIRGFSQRYNLTNDNLYTKSHCLCDDRLYSCLKENTTPTAHIMGTIYFNLVQIPCLEDTKSGRRYRKAKNNF